MCLKRVPKQSYTDLRWYTRRKMKLEINFLTELKIQKLPLCNKSQLLCCVAAESWFNSPALTDFWSPCSSLFRAPDTCAECLGGSRLCVGEREQQRPCTPEAAAEQRGERLAPPSIKADHNSSHLWRETTRSPRVMHQRRFWPCFRCDLLK